MAATDIIAPPPIAPPFPLIFGIAGGVVLAIVLILVSSKFDITKGPLTISILVILAFIAALTFSLYYTVPQDPTTSAIVGALVSSVGAIVAYWLTKKDDDKRDGSNHNSEC